MLPPLFLAKKKCNNIFMNKHKKQFEQIKKHLGIDYVLSVRFSNAKSKKIKKFQDTACTAMARALMKKIPTFIDRKSGQLCPGGDYFLNISHLPTKEVRDVYVKQEKVFINNSICNSFLKNLPKYPINAQKRYILLTPLAEEKSKPDAIILLANPAQTGRILGLSAYEKFSLPFILPTISTCASLYAPIYLKKIHLNFIDYYDRYYQGKQNKKLIWRENQLLVSMNSKIFEKIIENIPNSPHGAYKPRLKPQIVDY